MSQYPTLSKMEIGLIFPTAIGLFDIGRPLSEKELLFVQNEKDRPNINNKVSADNYVLKNDEMRELREWIEKCVDEYFRATVNPKHEANLRITQSWLSISETGQSHHRHAHANSFLSGVFYLQTNATDKINFYRPNFNQIKFTPETHNIFNCESWWFDATVGKLIIFPSSLEHDVPTVQGSLKRISLSFNTFPVGFAGEELDCTALQL